MLNDWNALNVIGFRTPIRKISRIFSSSTSRSRLQVLRYFSDRSRAVPPLTLRLLTSLFRLLIMALRISLSPSASLRGSSPQSSPAVAAWCRHHRLSPAESGRRTAAMLLRDAKRGFRVSPVRSSLETVEPTVGKVTEVNKDTFWPLVKAAGPKVVVLDMYTQWYNPYFQDFYMILQ